MSLKRVLGTMLASRMAGRGRRRGSLGTAAMLGGRRGSRGKMGIAALGYMAYRAYQDQQSKQPKGAATSSSASSGQTTGDKLGAMVKNIADQFTGEGSSSSSAKAASGPTGEAAEGERAAEALSDETALLLIRAMVTSAYSDGALTHDERERIMGQIDEAGGDADDRAVMEREIANPKPLEELLPQVNDQDTAMEFYVASCAAVDTAKNRTYLADLRQRLGLSEEEAAEAEELAS